MKGNGTSLIVERSSWLVVLWRLKPQNLCHGVNCIPTMYTLVSCTISSPKCPLQISEQPCIQTNRHIHQKEWHEQRNNRIQERMAWIGVNAAQGRQWLNYQRGMMAGQKVWPHHGFFGPNVAPNDSNVFIVIATAISFLSHRFLRIWQNKFGHFSFVPFAHYCSILRIWQNKFGHFSFVPFAHYCSNFIISA